MGKILRHRLDYQRSLRVRLKRIPQQIFSAATPFSSLFRRIFCFLIIATFSLGLMQVGLFPMETMGVYAMIQTIIDALVNFFLNTWSSFAVGIALLPKVAVHST
jgi:hypothetical protein